MLLLLVDSGNPGLQTLMRRPENLHVLILVGLLMIAAFRKRLHVSALVAVPFLIFGSILIVQSLSFEFFPYVTVIGFMVRLAIGGVVFVLVPRFSLVFVRVMGILCGVSLIFWLLGFIGPWGNLVSAYGLRAGGAIDSLRFSILAHTYFLMPEGFGSRNAGMFWEPGALAGYLNLALLFLVCQRRLFSSRAYVRYLALFTAGVLSTFSTAGYLGLLAVYSVGVLTGAQPDGPRRAAGPTRWQWLPAGAVVLLAVALVWAWNRVDFLGPKVREQYEQAVSQTSASWYATRFGTLIQDWEYIRRRPWTGWGLHDRTRWALHGGIDHDRGRAMGNDFSGFTAKFGLLGMLTFTGLTFLGFQRLIGGRLSISILAVGAVLVILNGEAFLEHPIFLSLMFLAAASAGSDLCHRRHVMPSWHGVRACVAGGTSGNTARRVYDVRGLDDRGGWQPR